MRQPIPLKRQEPEQQTVGGTASFTGQSIDEWLAAAVAEQASRTAARSPATAADMSASVGTGRDDVAASNSIRPDESDVAAAMAGGGDDLVVETAAKTAAALGSVTTWIERAQEQLTATTRASTEAQKRTEAVVNDAIGAIGKRLEEIERRVDKSGGAPSEGSESPGTGTQEAPDGAFKGLENRIRSIAGHVAPKAPPQPGAAGSLGRRGLTSRDEVEAAVVEIRSHQAELERSMNPVRTPSSPKTSSASEGAASQGAASRAPHGGLDLDGIGVLRRDIDDLRGAIQSLATREQIGEIERSISGLAIDVADVRHRGGGDTAGLTDHFDDLHGQIQRLAEVRGPGEQLGKLSRDIDVLSHKLDIVAASGIDPAIVEGLTREVGEIRGMLAGSAASQDLSALDEQLSEIRRDIAKLSARQVDPREFTTLRIAVEEMRQTLARPSVGVSAAGITDVQAAMQQVAQDELQPIAALMAELATRFDRLERSVADTGSLDQLEAQIAALMRMVGSTTGTDPALASLHQGMSDLMSEVANWREGTIEIAERVARNVAREALTAPLARSGATHPIEAPSRSTERGEAIDERARDSLETVHTRLEDVVRRIGRLDAPLQARAEARAAPAPAQPAPTIRSQPEADPELRPALTEAQRATEENDGGRDRAAPAADNLVDEADRPLPAANASTDEVLLEPGADRPRAGSIFADPAADPADIKASFIAAARRAAQAASADVNRTKSSRFSDAIAAAGTGTAEGLPARIRAAIDRYRKPLLIGAAALALAVGGFKLVTDLTNGSQSRFAARTDAAPSVPVVTAPARSSAVPAARMEAPEPQTTNGVVDRPLATAPISAVATLPSMAATPEQRDAPQTVAAEPAKPAPSGPDLAKVDDRSNVKVDNAAKPKVEASLGAPAQTLPTTPSLPDVAPAAALNGLKQAANAGDAVALYELGARTADGRGVTKDLRAAAALFEKAAEKNLAPAQYRTGNLYEKGIGVPRDIDAAKKWYQRAAENGNSRAMHNLAVLIAEGGGGRPDYAAALGWFQRAAEYGVRDSQFNLAVLSARGLGGNQDLVKSYTWFAVAAGQGDEEAGRKRDEVASRLQPTDLAKAKAAAERWRPTSSPAAANDVQVPAGGWSVAAEPAAAKRSAR